MMLSGKVTPNPSFTLQEAKPLSSIHGKDLYLKSSNFFRFLPYVYLFLLIFNFVETFTESMLALVKMELVFSWLMVLDWLDFIKLEFILPIFWMLTSSSYGFTIPLAED